MKFKVAETTPLQLDWLVAVCEAQRGEEHKGPDWLAWLVPAPNMIPHFHPSTDGAQGVPIMEREHIGIDFRGFGEWEAWDDKTMPALRHLAPTLLIAAMRCYVASRLGDEVEIPEELL